MRPRSAGTFLISRSATSAKRAARSQMRSIVGAVEVLDREQVPHAAASGRLGVDDRDLVDAVELARRARCTRSPRAVGRFLPT